MSFFTGIFRSRDKPQDRTAGSGYAFFMGGSTAGKSVNERTAMQMTAVYSCVRILSEAVAGLPLHMYRYTGDGGKEKAVDHPLYRLLHDEPNPEMSSGTGRISFRTETYRQNESLKSTEPSPRKAGLTTISHRRCFGTSCLPEMAML